MSRTMTDARNAGIYNRGAAGCEFRVQTLLDALSQRTRCPDMATAAGFDGLLRLAASLPLTTEEFAFARNWITGARRLWEEGEPGAARYQVEMVGKKLGL